MLQQLIGSDVPHLQAGTLQVIADEESDAALDFDPV